ncbi:SOS response-associated peptidase [Salinarchaeum laminariae]|uniref:SOS response-associated peptidase n=1 Tax=Salinarchaeum laminariae TaxID=869888 RepID=UPI0020C0BF9F|nr:SOS response-associated peptidase [Salinarchaeum laminariae]
MCGRFTLFAGADDLGERFSVSVPAEYSPRYNVSPSQPVPLIGDDDPGRIQFRTWGLLPEWADDATEHGYINARAETIEEKPAFRSAVRRRRCLVPADGFYEWTGDRGSRQPYRVAFGDDRLFAMAGIWERWEGPRRQTGLDDFGVSGEEPAGSDGRDEPPTEVRETVAILTTAAAGPVAEIHDRMPVIFPPDREREWLDADDEERRAELLRPFEAPGFRAYRVSTAVNDPGNDEPALVEPMGS